MHVFVAAYETDHANCCVRHTCCARLLRCACVCGVVCAVVCVLLVCGDYKFMPALPWGHSERVRCVYTERAVGPPYGESYHLGTQLGS